MKFAHFNFFKFQDVKVKVLIIAPIWRIDLLLEITFSMHISKNFLKCEKTNTDTFQTY